MPRKLSREPCITGSAQIILASVFYFVITRWYIDRVRAKVGPPTVLPCCSQAETQHRVLGKSHQSGQGNPSRGEGVVKALGLLLSLSQMSPGHWMRWGCSSSIPRTHCPSCRELSPKTWSSQTQLPTHTVLCWLILDVFQLSEGEIGGISFSYKSLCNWKCYLSSQKPCPFPSLSHLAKPSKLLSLESSGNSQDPCHRDCQTQAWVLQRHQQSPVELFQLFHCWEGSC